MLQIPADHYFHLSFVGGGGLFPLLLGKGLALRKYLRQRVPSCEFLYSGISSGCFCALLLALDYSEEEIHQIATHYLIEPFEKKWYLMENFTMWYCLKRTLRLIVGSDGHEHVKNRLRIGISKLSPNWKHKTCFKKVIVNKFRSSEHLVNSILTSCHIVVLGRQPVRVFDKDLAVDGGLSFNYIGTEDLPDILQKRTLTFRINYDGFPQSIRNFQHALPLLTQNKWNTLYRVGKTFFDIEIQPNIESLIYTHYMQVVSETDDSIIYAILQCFPHSKSQSKDKDQTTRKQWSQNMGLLFGWIDVTCGYIVWGLLFIWRFILNHPF